MTARDVPEPYFAMMIVAYRYKKRFRLQERDGKPTWVRRAGPYEDTIPATPEEVMAVSDCDFLEAQSQGGER